MEKKIIYKSIFFNYLGYFFHALISIFATPIIVHSLGDAQYGIWSLIVSATGYYGLLNLGIRSALTKYIAEYGAKGDDREINKLFNSSFVFFVIVSFAIVALSFILARFFDVIFIVDTVDINIIRNVVMVVGVNIAISFIFQPFDAILTAFNRFGLKNIIGVTSSIVRTVFIVVALKLGYGLLSMAFVILIVDLITHVVVVTFSKKVFSNIEINPVNIYKESIKKLWNFGLFNFMRHLSQMVVNKTDVIVIGIFLGPSQVAIYSIAEGLIRYIWVIVKGIARVILPVASWMSANSEAHEVKKIILIISKYITIICCYVFVQFYFFGDHFISIWIGDGYYMTYVIFCLLMSVRLGMMISETMIASVVGMGRNKFLGYISLVEAIINIALSLWFVRLWGLVGVAMGTIISMSLTKSIIVPIYCCKHLHITKYTFFKEALFPSIIVLLPLILSSFLISKLVPPTCYLNLFVDTLFTLSITCLLFYKFIEPELKHKIKHVCYRQHNEK